MQTFFIALFAFLIVMSLMAVGVIMGRKPISGSCGGVGAALQEPNYECDLCGGDEAKCESINSMQAQNAESGKAPSKKAKYYPVD